MAGQSFDKDAIINKYKQFFGEDITSIYQDIDSYDFYKDKSLPKGLPLVLNGYMVIMIRHIPLVEDIILKMIKLIRLEFLQLRLQITIKQ
jgi:hypothetical protein